MKKLRVNVGDGYDVFIGRELLTQVGRILSETLCGDIKTAQNMKLAIFTDSVIDKLYAAQLENVLSETGFQVYKYVYKEGESSKRIAVVADFVDFMAERHFNRKDAVVVLGGGVAGDMGGFAASVYMRGIKFIQIPTSLLAAVDSSVGGKTGVDIDAGKNLMGSFWQPASVICDTDLFQSLSTELILDGLAEVIKTAVICDADFFAELEHMLTTKHRESIALNQYKYLTSIDENNFDPDKSDVEINALAVIMDNIETIVAHCIDIKRRVVETDERESGIRKILNFGHTMGHAIEKHAKYRLSHGRAVVMGMCMINRAAEKRGLTKAGIFEHMKGLFERCGYLTSYDAPTEILCKIAAHDKKTSGESISLVYLSEIGKAEITDIALSEMESFFS